MGRENGENPDLDFKAPEENADQEQSKEQVSEERGKFVEKQGDRTIEQARDKAILESFLSKYSNGDGFDEMTKDLRFEVKNGENTEIANFSQVLEAVQRSTGDGVAINEETGKAREIIGDALQKEVDYMTGRAGVENNSTRKPETANDFVRRLSPDSVQLMLQQVEKVATALGVYGEYTPNFEEVKNAIEDARGRR